jgi:RNA polymerase sigma-70 factor (ECF subfamily)
MTEEQPFRDLIRRVRSGDEQAATDLVRQYEPAIRRAVRVRLRDNHLRRQLDSMDICQSILLNFFVRVAAGQFELDTPDQLLRLLATMARNKLINHAVHLRSEHRATTDISEGNQVAASDPSPSRHVAAQELLKESLRRLAPDERRLLELRQQGREWAEVAALIGGTPEALRKQLARAVERVGRQLGLDEVRHE